MALLKRKEAKPYLASDIARLQADLIAFIEQKTLELKQTQAGADLPIEVCRQQVTRGDHCYCRMADRLLKE